MEKETVYLDTSIISAYYDKRSKDRQEATIKFWNEILLNYKVYISEITIQELSNTKDKLLKVDLLDMTKEFKVLKSNKKIENLARLYVEHGIFPEKYFDDALHVAIASYYKVPYLVSWNFTHLVKVKTRRMVNSINTLAGFEVIEIISPQEL
ncbi:MAG: type II toxin-antitoxin system VapC family toxin [Proteobacteria bacterium]|nr:type II toxin-antitoxin system VapC family toxin [Pseudomonadota bacterium]